MGRHRQRGFALLIVLWSMALLALIGTQVTAAGHSEALLASNLRDSAVAEAAADGAVFETVFHLLDGSAAHWPPGGPPHRIRLPQAVVDVTVVDEGRKLPLNTAPSALMGALLEALGVDAHTAAVLADQIADWRSPSEDPQPLGAKAPQYRAAGRAYGPPRQPFRSVDELALVLAMTPEILARLRPYVSPYTESIPPLDGADPVMTHALTEAGTGGAPPPAGAATTISITAVAVGAAGARFARRAVVRLSREGGVNPNAPQFLVLDWDQESGDRGTS